MEQTTYNEDVIDAISDTDTQSVTEYAEGDGPLFENDTNDAEMPADVCEDYEAMANADLGELKREFYEARSLSSIAELDNPVRFAELRELGLSPKEAYLATQRPKSRTDNRSHLVGSAPISAAHSGVSMTRGELQRARELFSGMSDGEIQELYKRVAK